MTATEDIMAYGTRTARLVERLINIGVPESKQPLALEQSTQFINGLNSSLAAYNTYKIYFHNSTPVSSCVTIGCSSLDSLS